MSHDLKTDFFLDRAYLIWFQTTRLPTSAALTGQYLPDEQRNPISSHLTRANSNLVAHLLAAASFLGQIKHVKQSSSQLSLHQPSGF